jgi:hypothetical protein
VEFDKPGASGEAAEQTPRTLSVALIILCQSTQPLIYGGIALSLPLIRADLGLSFTQAGAIAAASSIVFLNTLGPLLVGALGWRALFELFSAGAAISALTGAMPWRRPPPASA